MAETGVETGLDMCANMMKHVYNYIIRMILDVISRHVIICNPTLYIMYIMSNHVIMFLHAQKYAAVRRAPLQKVSCQCCEILTRNASPACNSKVIRRNRYGQKDPLLHQVIQVAMDLSSVISFISVCLHLQVVVITTLRECNLMPEFYTES